MDRHAHNARRVGDQVLASESAGKFGTADGQSSDKAEFDRCMRAAAFLEIHPLPGQLHSATPPISQLQRTRVLDCHPDFHPRRLDERKAIKKQPRQEYRNNWAGYTAAESATPNQFDGSSPMDLDEAHDLEDRESEFLQMKEFCPGEKRRKAFEQPQQKNSPGGVASGITTKVREPLVDDAVRSLYSRLNDMVAHPSGSSSDVVIREPGRSVSSSSGPTGIKESGNYHVLRGKMSRPSKRRVTPSDVQESTPPSPCSPSDSVYSGSVILVDRDPSSSSLHADELGVAEPWEIRLKAGILAEARRTGEFPRRHVSPSYRLPEDASKTTLSNDLELPMTEIAVIVHDYKQLSALRQLRGNPVYPPSAEYLQFRSAIELEIRGREAGWAPAQSCMSLSSKISSKREEKMVSSLERGLEEQKMGLGQTQSEGAVPLRQNLDRFDTQLESLDGNLRRQVSTTTGICNMLNDTITGHRVQLGNLEMEVGRLNRTIGDLPSLLRDAVREVAGDQRNIISGYGSRGRDEPSKPGMGAFK